MDEISRTIQDLPLGGLVPVILVMLVGLMLWAAGRRVLRAAFAAAGLLIGGAGGWMVGAGTAMGVDPWIPALVLGIAVACLAALVYRVALATALAAVCAIAGPVAVVTVAELQGLEGPAAATGREAEAAAEEPAAPGRRTGPESLAGTIRDTIDEASDWLYRDASEEADDDAPAPFDREEEIEPAPAPEPSKGEETTAERVAEARDLADRVREAASGWWESTPVTIRPALIAATCAGGLVGLLFGTLAPSLTSILVSAFGGSLLWLGGARILLAGLGEDILGHLPSSATFALTVWLITALIGAAIQWTFRPKPADTSG